MGENAPVRPVWPADAVERRALDSLVPYARNARTHSEMQIGQIAASIREWGWTMPVLVDEVGTIVAGHGRVLAAARLGLGEVPVMVACGWSEAQKRAYVLADNKLTDNAGWDEALLRIEVADLASMGFDLPLIGFDEQDLARLTGSNSGLTDPDEVPEVPAVPVAQRGEVWQLGRHRLMCGDATKAEDVGRALASVKLDAILTDPPYGMGLDTDFSTIKGSLKLIGRQHQTRGNCYAPVIGDDQDFDPSYIVLAFSAVAEQFWFGADYYAERIPDRVHGSWLVWDKRKESQSDAIGSEFELCWSRQKHKRRMLRHDWFGFLSSQNGSDARNRMHPTQKPVTLFQDIIDQWITAGGRIFDPFVGSGTTIIAAEMTARACHAIEINPTYCDVTIERWQNFTGEKARRVHG